MRCWLDMWLQYLLFSVSIWSSIGTKTFIVSFQSSKGRSLSPSTEEWIQYAKPLPPFKEFTACNWIKADYFGRDIAVVLWSYCTKETVDSTMNCLQIYLTNNRQTANRHLKAYGYFPWSSLTSMKVNADVRPYFHRTWFHFCWSFSSISGKSKMYYNGDLINTQHLKLNGTLTALLKPSKMFKEAFMFGQEPDSLMGKFDPLETFIGDLSELNVWSCVLPDDAILNMSHCLTYREGDIVSWKKDNWKINKAVVQEEQELNSFCNIPKQYIIFPEKKLFKDAQRICEVHGGKLALPKSENEQTVLMNLLQEYKHQCSQQTESTIDKLAWLGAIKVDKKWHEIEPNGSPGKTLDDS